MEKTSVKEQITECVKSTEVTNMVNWFTFFLAETESNFPISRFGT